MIANKAVARLTPLSIKMAEALKNPYLRQCPAFAVDSLQECQKEARSREKWMAEGMRDGGNAGGMVVWVPRSHSQSPTTATYITVAPALPTGQGDVEVGPGCHHEVSDHHLCLRRRARRVRRPDSAHEIFMTVADAAARAKS